MKKLSILLCKTSFNLGISEVSFCGETSTAKEVESYFYADGQMKCSKGQFEITYYFEGDKITRTRVYDTINRKVFPDDKILQVVRY